MGNRATVIFTDGKAHFSPAIYLHWNGGPESIYAFLAESERRGVNGNYDGPPARFIQLVGEFFDQSEQNPKHRVSSLGVVNGPKSAEIADLDKVGTDHGDNGFYLVNWTETGLSMRRFRSTAPDSSFSTWHLVEQTPEWVAAERKAAQGHEYATGLNEFFLELDEKLGIEPFPERQPKVALDESTHDFGDGPVPAHRHSNGGGWVAETARVDEFSYVGYNAAVFDRAIVTDGAIITDHAEVRDDAKVFGEAQIGVVARVHGKAEVYGTAQISGNAVITEDARVHGNAIVSGNATVFGKVDIGNDARISGESLICDPERGAQIRAAESKAEYQYPVRAKMHKQNGVAAKATPAPLPEARG